jgi:hypothetical protein
MIQNRRSSASFASSKRCASDSVEPTGFWWFGFTITAAIGPFFSSRRSRSKSSPSCARGTGTTSSPSPSRIGPSMKYPGDSTATRRLPVSAAVAANARFSASTAPCVITTRPDGSSVPP